jgi:glutathione S-transferase
MEWMTWMQSGLGPMQGQANHFFRYAPEKIEYAIKRYQTEVRPSQLFPSCAQAP